jgi:DNA-binding CsgD family transcriptional regulator
MPADVANFDPFYTSTSTSTSACMSCAALISKHAEIERARTAVEALGLIGLPAAVISFSHRLLAANKLLKQLVPGVVQNRSSRIGLADRRGDALLARSLLQLHGHAGQHVRSIPVAATPEEPASIVHLIPLSNAVNEIFGAASCVLVVTAVARQEIASAQVIQGLFDLTPAEARIARGVAVGKTVDQVANEAGLAAGTIRHQLKSVFSKTGVSRQSDLVGILAGSALWSPGGFA